MCALKTQNMFLLFLPFLPAVAVHSVAFVRIMVTCHIAKRSTPKHSALYRWRVALMKIPEPPATPTSFLSPFPFLFVLSRFIPQFTSPLTPLHHKDNPLIARPHQHVHHCTGWSPCIMEPLGDTVFFLQVFIEEIKGSIRDPIFKGGNRKLNFYHKCTQYIISALSAGITKNSSRSPLSTDCLPYKVHIAFECSGV